MKATAGITQSTLLRLLKSHPHPLFHRHICAPPENPPLPSEDQSFVTHVATVLESDDNDWLTNKTLHQLLFPSSSDSFHTLSPRSLLRIARRLRTTDKALKFFNYIRRVSPSPPQIESLSATFQAVFEIAIHEEPDAVTKVFDFYSMSKDFNVPLSPNSVNLLLRFFGRAGLVDKALHVYNSLDPDERNTHIRNRVIDVLFRSGRMDVALQLLDEMLEPEGACLPNDNTADIVFGALLKKNWSGRRVRNEEIVDFVLKFYKRHVFPDAMWLSQLIAKLCSDGNSTWALDLLHELMELGANVDISLWNALMIGLAKEGDFEKINVLQNEMNEKNAVPNSVTVQILISYLCKFQRVDAALEVFKAMTEGDKIVPNILTVQILISYLCKFQRVDAALEVFKAMTEGDKIVPNILTVQILISYLCKFQRVDAALEVFKAMTEGDKSVPNILTVQILISYLCKFQRVDAALEVFKAMTEGDKIVPNILTVQILISYLCKFRRVDAALEVFKAMTEGDKIVPNILTVQILISYLCKFRRVDAALEVFKTMTEGDNGIYVQPNVFVYNTLINGLCKVQRQDEGLALMRQMHLQHKCIPNSGTYNCLIDWFCKSGDVDKSYELFNEMNKLGKTPNVATLNSLVQKMCRNGQVNSAMDLFRQLQAKNLKVNTVTCTALICAFCNANNIDKATELFIEMSKNGCSLGGIVYIRLITGLCKAGKLEYATFVASMMEKAGFCLDLACYNTLISAFCKKDRIEKTFELVQDMDKAGVKADIVTYNTLISYFGNKGDFAMAHRVMTTMIHNGYSPNIVTYDALITAYCLAGKLEEAMYVFREMSVTWRVLPDTGIYNILINAFCKNDNVEFALSLMTDMKKKEVKRSISTFNAMLKGLRDMNWIDEELKLIDQMSEEDCNPDYTTMEILTEWLPAFSLNGFQQPVDTRN